MMNDFENLERKCQTTMLVSKGSQNAPKKLTLFSNCRFVMSSKKIVQLKMIHNVWQPIFD